VPGIEIATGDVLQPESLLNGVRGCDTIIHLVGSSKKQIYFFSGSARRGDTQHDYGEAERRKALHPDVGLGTRPNAAAKYHQTKWQAEELVRASG
jgi:NADH dehydrogenase